MADPILPLNTFGSRVARLKAEGEEEREMSSLYKMKYTKRQALLLEYMRKLISEDAGFGITLTGNRVTLRWTMPGEKELVEVHMIVVSTHDERDVEELEDAEDAEDVSMCKCGEEAEEPHPCPYSVDMHDDPGALCNCCIDCQNICCDDI